MSVLVSDMAISAMVIFIQFCFRDNQGVFLCQPTRPEVQR